MGIYSNDMTIMIEKKTQQHNHKGESKQKEQTHTIRMPSPIKTRCETRFCRKINLTCPASLMEPFVY